MPTLTNILERTYARYVAPKDQALLELVFHPAPSQQDVDDGLALADIEALGAEKALLLSYFLHDNPQFSLSAYAEPRLRGLMQFFHFKNTRTLAHLSRIGKALNKAAIPFVLFKGGAMKALRPNLSRPMGDTDILLPKGTIHEAVKICEGLGYQHIHGKPTHAVGMHTDTEDAVDLHYLVFDDEGYDLEALQEGIFRRSAPHSAFGVNFLLPTSEDLFSWCWPTSPRTCMIRLLWAAFITLFATAIICSRPNLTLISPLCVKTPGSAASKWKSVSQPSS